MRGHHPSGPLHLAVRSAADGNHDARVHDLRLHDVDHVGGWHAPIGGADDGQRQPHVGRFIGVLVREAPRPHAPRQATFLRIPPRHPFQHARAVGGPPLLHGVHCLLGEGHHGRGGGQGYSRVREGEEQADRQHGRRGVQRLDVVHVGAFQAESLEHLLLVGGVVPTDFCHLRQLQGPSLDERPPREPAVVYVAVRLHHLGGCLCVGRHPVSQRDPQPRRSAGGVAPEGNDHPLRVPWR
mmetsp:Transcript_33399/g.92250  ORF Transcript_33399/g.92250 Transcript_33399/m.92250 type:complete len:239 (-) Transcript_33399:388-1104(-)